MGCTLWAPRQARAPKTRQQMIKTCFKAGSYDQLAVPFAGGRAVTPPKMATCSTSGGFEARRM